MTSAIFLKRPIPQMENAQERGRRRQRQARSTKNYDPHWVNGCWGNRNTPEPDPAFAQYLDRHLRVVCFRNGGVLVGMLREQGLKTNRAEISTQAV